MRRHCLGGGALVLLAGIGFGAAAFAQTPPAAPAQGSAPAPGAAAPAKPAPETVLARVDGTPITEADLQVAAEDPSLNLPGVPEEQKRDLLLGYLVDLRVAARAAEAAKLAQGPDFDRRLAYAREKILLDLYLEPEIEREVKRTVTPEAMRKLYDDTFSKAEPEAEVRARHILVETEEEARKAHARVKAGEDFAKVAGDLSKDPGSKAGGGDLGFFTRDRMVPAFAEAAFKLEPGQVSEPVKSPFGWHVIKVEERRNKPAPTFEQVKDQVEAYLTRKAQQDVVLRLRNGAKVERLETAKPADAPAAPR